MHTYTKEINATKKYRIIQNNTVKGILAAGL